MDGIRKNSKNGAVSKSGNNSPGVERAFRLLELLAKNPQGLNSSAISAILDIPRNSVFRITKTLLDSGYLLRDKKSKVFTLSTQLLILGMAALQEPMFVEKSIDYMYVLRDKYGETVPLGILRDNSGLVIETLQGTHPFRFVLQPGRQFNLHTSAPGKAMMAFLPDDEQDILINRLDYKIFNERTIDCAERMKEVLMQVRRDGYATDKEEEVSGMHCVGAPIFNRKGYPFAAIWISGPSHRITTGDFTSIGADVAQNAMAISKSLGHNVNNKKN
jgi:DNA-binding IclR family transcriptional regulator